MAEPGLGVVSLALLAVVRRRVLHGALPRLRTDPGVHALRRAVRRHGVVRGRVGQGRPAPPLAGLGADRPGRPHAPVAVDGAGLLVAGVDLEGGAVAAVAVGVGEEELEAVAAGAGAGGLDEAFRGGRGGRGRDNVVRVMRG